MIVEFSVVFLLLLFLCGCASSQSVIQGVILPATEEFGFPWSKDGKPEGIWLPTGEMVRQAEPVIAKYIREQDAGIFGNIESYRCQYIGILIKGKKRIYCNFFWLDEWEDENWEKEPLFVMDGGDAYFQLEYDVESGQCLHFSVNGEA